MITIPATQLATSPFSMGVRIVCSQLTLPQGTLPRSSNSVLSCQHVSTVDWNFNLATEYPRVDWPASGTRGQCFSHLTPGHYIQASPLRNAMRPQGALRMQSRQLRIAVLGRCQRLLLSSLSRDRIWQRSVGHSQNRRFDRKTNCRYTCPASLGVTIIPSGNTTIKKWFIRPATANCLAHSPAAGKFPLTISERVKRPNESRPRTFEIATRMTATTKDKKIKTILS